MFLLDSEDIVGHCSHWTRSLNRGHRRQGLIRFFNDINWRRPVTVMVIISRRITQCQWLGHGNRHRMTVAVHVNRTECEGVHTNVMIKLQSKVAIEIIIELYVNCCCQMTTITFDFEQWSTYQTTVNFVAAENSEVTRQKAADVSQQNLQIEVSSENRWSRRHGIRTTRSKRTARRFYCGSIWLFVTEEFVAAVWCGIILLVEGEDWIRAHRPALSSEVLSHRRWLVMFSNGFVE